MTVQFQVSNFNDWPLQLVKCVVVLDDSAHVGEEMAEAFDCPAWKLNGWSKLTSAALVFA